MNKKFIRKRNCKSWRRNCKSRRRNLKKVLIPGNSSPHPLTNFEIEEYYENEPRFNGVYSRDLFPKTIKNGGTHWIAPYVKNNEVIYFDSFGVKHIPKEIKRFIGRKNIKINIF